MSEGKTVRAWLDARLAWFTVSGVAWATSLVLAVAVAGCLVPVPSALIRLALAGLAGGAFVGLVQWLTLSLKVRGAGAWLAASAVGWSTGLSALAAVDLHFGQPWGKLCAGLAGGLICGGLQSLALRTGAGKPAWLLVTATGWTVALAISHFLPAQDAQQFLEAAVRLAAHEAVGLVVLGMVAALCRVLLLADFGQKDRTEQVKWWP